MGGAVDPGFLFGDFVEDVGRDVGGEFVLVVGGAAGHGEYFAGFDFDSDDGTVFSFECVFSGLLDIDVDTCC